MFFEGFGNHSKLKYLVIDEDDVRVFLDLKLCCVNLKLFSFFDFEHFWSGKIRFLMWQRVRGFVANIEKNIDAEFAPVQVNVQEKTPETSIQNYLSDDDDNSKIDFKPEDDAETHKEQLKQRISEIEEQTESLNLQFEKYQNVLKEIGDDGILLLQEFEKRQRKLKNDLSRINSTEDHLKQEIEDLIASSPNVQLDSTVKTPEEALLSELKEQESKLNQFYSKSEIDIEKIKKDIAQVDMDIGERDKEFSQFSEELNHLQEDLQKHLNEFKKKIPATNERIEQLSNKIEQLSLQLGSSEIELKSVSSEKEKFDQQISRYKAQIDNLRMKRDNADLVAQKMNEEKKILISNSMKDFTNKELQKLEKIRANLREERSELTELKIEQEDRHNQEMSSMQALLTSNEIENAQLKIRFDNLSKKVLPNLTNPLIEQIESLKIMKETSEKAFESFSNRMREEMAQIDAKKLYKDEQIKEIQENILKEKNEKQKQLIDGMESLKQLKEELLSKCTQSHIDSLKQETEKTKEELADLKLQLEKSFSKQRSLNEKIKNLKTQEETEKKNYEARMKTALATVEQGKKPTTFARWKELTKKIAQLDKEEGKLGKEIEESKEIQILFDQSVEMIAERQEQVESVKRAIQREKDYFQRTLKTLIE